MSDMTPDELAGALIVAAMLTAAIALLTWGLCRMAARGDVRPMPLAEYEATADRWRPAHHCERHEREEHVEDWPYDQDLDNELAAAEDYLSAWADEQRRNGGAA